MIMIFVFDIDGTISKNGLKVSDEICTAITHLLANHQVIFASARPIRDMLPMLNTKLTEHKNTILVGCNGGMAYQQGNVILSKLLDNQYVKNCLTQLNQLNLAYVLDGKWAFSLSKQPHDFHHYIDSLSNDRIEERDLLNDGVSKILVLLDRPNQAIYDQFNVDNISFHIHKKEHFFDITPQGNNKYHTLKQLIGNQDYVVFGNDFNDFLMLEQAKLSVYLGDKQEFQADYYLDDVDLVGKFINQHFL
ncbi:HAD-IIB family hydrolase [Lonepinella sp. MS14437]|uniref:HAD-IIB family hydrolase n=1 Tax=unclassified Lonepinella TaxID=2642006 RepID=UPI0036DE4B59